MTPLMIATERSRYEEETREETDTLVVSILTLLLMAGADLDAKDNVSNCNSVRGRC
jgi:hypothetical protein